MYQECYRLLSFVSAVCGRRLCCSAVSDTGIRPVYRPTHPLRDVQHWHLLSYAFTRLCPVLKFVSRVALRRGAMPNLEHVIIEDLKRTVSSTAFARQCLVLTVAWAAT
eukprot:2743434-Rhodomonas_salina.3